MENNLIKSVFCSYRGILVVHDIKGNRVDHLCGELTLEKHEEIEKLTSDVTEFDGLDDYKRIVSKKYDDLDAGLSVINKVVGQAAASPQLPPPQQGSLGQVFQIEVENTTDNVLPVVLFGANYYGKNNNFGNDPGINISNPLSYAKMLTESMIQGLNINTISFYNINAIDGMDIVNTSATGAQKIYRNEIKNWVSAFSQVPDTAVINQKFVITGSTEIKLKLNKKSKAIISLTT